MAAPSVAFADVDFVEWHVETQPRGAVTSRAAWRLVKVRRKDAQPETRRSVRDAVNSRVCRRASDERKIIAPKITEVDRNGEWKP